MKKLLVYLKEYKKETILGPLFKLLEASFELFVPLVVASIVDKGIANQDTSYIIKMCLVLILLALIGLTCSITAQYFAAKAAVGFVTKIRFALFSHIQHLSYKELDETGTSTLVTRLTSDINQVQNGTNLTLRLLLRSPFVVLGAMVMAFTIDVKAALVFVVTIPILSIVVFAIMLKCRPLYQQVQNALDRITQSTRENLLGVRVIRAFCKEETEIDSFHVKNDQLTSLQKYVGKISALLNPLTYVLINIATVVLIYVGALRVDIGILTQGQVIALYNYMSQILVELIKLADLIINITKAIACGNRVQSIFEIQPSLHSGDVKQDQESDYLIEMDHVDLNYTNDGDASLQDINLKVKKGQTIGIIGATGSGKTSIINLICRFYDATSGKVSYRGKDVKDYQHDYLLKKIGLVPQKVVLFQGTILENLLWSNENASTQDIEEALEMAQAKEVVDKKEGGLDYQLEQNGRNLSGGQKQRLTIARALVKKPEILILDDSSSALDFATDAALRKAIRSCKEEMTVFIVSQRTSSLQHADQILVLEDGKVAGIGKHDELLENCLIYKEIYDLQFKKGDQQNAIN